MTENIETNEDEELPTLPSYYHFLKIIYKEVSSNHNQIKHMISVLTQSNMYAEAATMLLIENVPAITEYKIKILTPEQSKNVSAISPASFRTFENLKQRMNNPQYNPQYNLLEYTDETVLNLQRIKLIQMEVFRLLFMNRYEIINEYGNSKKPSDDVQRPTLKHTMLLTTGFVEFCDFLLPHFKNFIGNLDYILSQE